MVIRLRDSGMQFALLDGLDDPERRELLAAARRRRFARREVVFHEGDPGDSVHLVVSGHLAVRVTTALGDVALLRVIAPGGFVGELALLDGAPRSATVAAIEGAETMSVQRAAFDALQRRSPHAQTALSAALGGEIRRLAAALVEATYLPVEERFWRRVLDMVGVFGPGSPIPLTQEELGQLAGAARPTANRLLRDGQADGSVTLRRGTLDVLDVALVRRKAGLRPA